MIIYITFKKNDKYNSKLMKIFFNLKYLFKFLNNKDDFGFKEVDFFLDENDPLKIVIEEYKILKKNEKKMKKFSLHSLNDTKTRKRKRKTKNEHEKEI